MTRLQSHSPRVPSASRLLLAASAVAFGLAGPAHAQTRERLDVAISGSADTNPFLLPGEETDSGTVTLTVDPAVFIEDDRATLAIEGRFRLEQYTTRYGTDLSASLNASGTSRLSERTTLSSRVGFRSSRSAARDAFLSNDGDLFELPVDEFLPDLVPDVTTAGRRTRLTAFEGAVSLAHALSPLDGIEFGVRASHVDTDAVGDHRIAGFAGGYRRRVTERTWADATFDLGYADYLGRSNGDAIFLTQLVGAEHQVTQSTSVSAQAGATYTSIETLAGDSRKNVAFAVSFDLCDRRARQTLCATASRKAHPTAFGGVSTVTSLGVSYGANLGEKDRISFAGRYGRSKSIVEEGFQDQDSKVFTLSSTYSRDLNDRLSAFVAPSFSRVNSDHLLERRSNFRVEVGVRMRIGALR
jgi:hypothetical protein